MSDGPRVSGRTVRTWAGLAATVLVGILLGAFMWTWYLDDETGPPLIKAPSTIGAVVTIGVTLLTGALLSLFRAARRFGVALLIVAVVAAGTRWGIETYLYSS